jgi:serine-type D-Ala-D-Ala carboxypeptidase (penicillin-binding protein 5/6)
MQMKQALKIGWVFVIILWAVTIISAPLVTSAATEKIATKAEGAALIDVDSGRILYSKQGDKPMRIASLTKVMTAIVAIESGKLTDEVKISSRAAGKEGSSIYLKAGETMSLQHLLYGMMLRSGNDAATAVAEHVGGSVEGFVYLMQQKAELIGMEHAAFSNPTGLDEGKGNIASANDMAKLTAYALRNPVFQDIVKTKLKRVPNPDETWDYVWSNKNKMLSIYDGADGVKTGYTKLANRCLITSATKEGQQLAVVTLNDREDWIDHKKLLDYGFNNFPLIKLAGQAEKAGDEGLFTSKSFEYPLSADEKSAVTKEVVRKAKDSVDYRLGIKGELLFKLEGRTIGSVPLLGELLQRPESKVKSSAASGSSRNGTMLAPNWADVWSAAMKSLFAIQ